jgi:glycosyltransferase involved in cell wall biosynthesis
MMQNNSVSCVIPAWNAAETIGRAIESVLGQTATVLEIVVVDDGSTDETAAIVAKMSKPIRLIRQPNLGPETARNRGFAESTGQFIALLDSDDVWLPNKIERQLHVMIGRPQVGVTGCLVRNIASSDHPSIMAQLRRYGNRSVPGWKGSDVLIRRRTFEQIGDFDSSLRHSGMTDWLQRCSAAGVERYLLPELLVERYLRADSQSMAKSEQGSMGNLDEYLMLAHRRIAAERLRKQQNSA